MQKSLSKYFAFFALPTAIVFTICFIAPFLMGVYLSFTQFTTVVDAKWVGLENYVKAFSGNKEFINALFFTTKFTIVTVITVNIFAFFLALLLTRAIKGTNFFRTIFFMPNLIGGIILGYIWQLIINGLLQSKGVTLLADASYGFWGLVVLMNWQMIGYMMIIYIAGLQNIPAEMFEAAKVDGAKPIQILTKIIIPLVMPSITICSFLMLTNSFKLFDQNLALTGGAPARQTAMLSLDIYDTFYGRMSYEGVGQAKAVVFFVLLAVIALVQLRLTRSREVEN